MNTKNNLRYQETEDKIIAAFTELLPKKDPGKITVSEICRICKINRSSFYLHYQDVPGMMDVIEKRLADYFGNLFTSTDSGEYNLGERFVRMFTFIYEHQAFYRAYFPLERQIRIFDVALPPSAAESVQNLAKKLGFQSEAEFRYRQTFFKAGLAAMLKEWVMGGCIEGPLEIAQILNREYHPLIS